MPKSDAIARRQDWLGKLFPHGIPPLWCPPLTHYAPDGTLDLQRIRAHLHWLAPHAPGWLVPGSTGDGWEMSDLEARRLLDHVLTVAEETNATVLIGILKKNGRETFDQIQSTLQWLSERAGTSDTFACLRRNRVCGFTVCPPAGIDLTQEIISESLVAILQLDVPIAIYQLPQVTENEMAPETLAELAGQFGNFIMFKDTSGTDTVALSNVDLGGVFMVRGAEGNYVRWPKLSEGPYDGFLLSTANVFAPQYSELFQLLAQGKVAEVNQLIAPIQRAVGTAFEAVSQLPVGNPFTNANKAMDHFIAFGIDGLRQPAPRLYSGVELPAEVLSQVGTTMQHLGLVPSPGYYSREDRP